MPKVGKFAGKVTDKVKKPDKIESLWLGPLSMDEARGGVTQSMVGQFLCCPERFRITNVLGLKPQPSFNHRLEYGHMWHKCEEHNAGGGDWREALRGECKRLCAKHNLQQQQVIHWYKVCELQFPHYVKYWENHEEMKVKTPIWQELKFQVPYKLPSGREVVLRGMFDEVDLIDGTEIWLQENKTKGEVDEDKIAKFLQFDLQTMFYLTALSRMADFSKTPIAGVRYNVIRRPLSGGKGSITKHKAKGSTSEETDEHFYARLSDVIKDDPGNFFKRWNVRIDAKDIATYEHDFLVPTLERLCDWYEHITACMHGWLDPFTQGGRPGLHYRFPYNVYNPMAEGRTSDLDEYLATGNETGLQRVERLFDELAEG